MGNHQNVHAIGPNYWYGDTWHVFRLDGEVKRNAWEDTYSTSIGRTNAAYFKPQASSTSPLQDLG